MEKYAQSGLHSKILNLENVVIGGYTVIIHNVAICDNNKPVNPLDRRVMMWTMPGGVEHF